MASILVVEDHPLFVQSLVRLLKDRGGYNVSSVGSGEDALQQLGGGLKYDLVMIDVSLPGMSGIDLVQAIHQKKPQLPCLMVSGHTATNYVHQSMELGARGYVLKEDISGILDAIKQVLRGGTFISRALRPKKDGA
jgi:DNA-binding NarL/FixJ family response regulator